MSREQRQAQTGGNDGGEAAVAPTQPASLPVAGSVIAGRYEIVRSLGAGAMGHVFLAVHTALNKEVAIKILSPQASGEPEQAERFLREARAASALRHPRIVEITDFGSTETGLPFFAMAYLRGEDLASYLGRSAPLGWSQVRALMLDILAGLTVAHAHGVVHRDLKPENIFLTQVQDGDDGPGRVTLLDFGIAKLLTEPRADRLTTDGHILGTPQYMSPEQAVGRAVDGRADLYACGVLLYELLTGALPFGEGSVMAILSQQITQPPPTLAHARPDLEALDELEPIVARALAKAPDDRYGSAEAFAAALDAVGRAPVRRAGIAAWWPRRLGIAAVAAASIAWVSGIGRGPESPPQQVIESTATDPASPRTLPAARIVPPLPKAPPTDVAPDADASAQPDAAFDPVDAAAPVVARAQSKRKPARTAIDPPAPPVEPMLPDVASDRTIAVQLERAVVSCGDFVSPGGQALTVRVRVAADGGVSAASVRPPYDGHHPLGRCVARQLNAARVPTALQGRDYEGDIRVAHRRAAPQ